MCLNVESAFLTHHVAASRRIPAKLRAVRREVGAPKVGGGRKPRCSETLSSVSCVEKRTQEEDECSKYVQCAGEKAQAEDKGCERGQSADDNTQEDDVSFEYAQSTEDHIQEEEHMRVRANRG